MGTKDFGQLTKQAARAKGMSQGRLGYLLTTPDGPFFDASQVRSIYLGHRRLTPELVERLIEILHPHLDPYEAWPAAGLKPPRLRPEHLRRLDELLRSEGAPVICGYCWSPAHTLGHERQVPAEQLAVAA